MTPDLAPEKTRQPDRRKPILVLYNERVWTPSFRETVGTKHKLEIPTGVKLGDIHYLSQQSWRLVLMGSVGAVTDQRLPLEALQSWFLTPNTEPVVVLSPFPTASEASNSIYAGAIWYTKVPWGAQEIEEVLTQSLNMARRFRRRRREDNLRNERQSLFHLRKPSYLS